MITHKISPSAYYATEQGVRMVATQLPTNIWELQVETVDRDGVRIEPYTSLSELEASYPHIGISMLVNESPIESNGSKIIKTPLKTSVQVTINLSQQAQEYLQLSINAYGFLLPNGETSLRNFADLIRKYSSSTQARFLANRLCIWEGRRHDS